MHLVYPPKFYINIFSKFLLGIKVVPREIEENGYAIVFFWWGGGGGGVEGEGLIQPQIRTGDIFWPSLALLEDLYHEKNGYPFL